jgi:hypothetical protein
MSTIHTADFEQTIGAFIEYRKPICYIHTVCSGGADRRIFHSLLHGTASDRFVF